MTFANYTGTARSVFVARNIGLRMLGVFNQPTYLCNPANVAGSTPAPAVGTDGLPVSLEDAFDGWGYMHLYRNTATDLVAVDHFAIEEGADPRFATGFGDLTVHEFATDPTQHLAYSSYYAGGLRVMSFGDNGLEQVGKFIDQGGNNFWGVEVFDSPRRQLSADDRRRPAHAQPEPGQLRLRVAWR
jgi:hypothetical protein